MRIPASAPIDRLWYDDTNVNDSNKWLDPLKSINKLRELIRKRILVFLQEHLNNPSTPRGQAIALLLDDAVGKAQGREKGGAPLSMPTGPSDDGDLLNRTLQLRINVIGVKPGALVAQFLRTAGRIGDYHTFLSQPQSIVSRQLNDRISAVTEGFEGPATMDIIAEFLIKFLELLQLYIPPFNNPTVWSDLVQRLVNISKMLQVIFPPLEGHPNFMAHVGDLKQLLGQCKDAPAFAIIQARRMQEFSRAATYDSKHSSIKYSAARTIDLGGRGDCFFFSLAYVLTDPVAQNVLNPVEGDNKIITRDYMSPYSEKELFDEVVKNSDKFQVAEYLRMQIISFIWFMGTPEQQAGPKVTPQDRKAMRHYAVSLFRDLFDRGDLKKKDYEKLDEEHADPSNASFGSRANKYIIDADRLVRRSYNKPTESWNGEWLETEDEYEARVESLYKIYMTCMRRSKVYNLKKEHTWDAAYADDAIVRAAALYFGLRITVYRYETKGGDYVVSAVHGPLSATRWVSLLLCNWDPETRNPIPGWGGNHYVPLVNRTSDADPFARDMPINPTDPPLWSPSASVQYSAPFSPLGTQPYQLPPVEPSATQLNPKLSLSGGRVRRKQRSEDIDLINRLRREYEEKAAPGIEAVKTADQERTELAKLARLREERDDANREAARERKREAQRQRWRASVPDDDNMLPSPDEEKRS